VAFVPIIASPPATHDLRPEKADIRYGRMEELLHRVYGLRWNVLFRRDRLKPMVRRIEKAGIKLKKLADSQLLQEVTQVREGLYRDGLSKKRVAASFALTREYADRILGMRHYKSQLTGGLVLLQGRIAEMDTGEGKTLTATLPAVTMALAGFPVHVITVNDYLTARDAEDMGELYRAMQITVGCVVHDMPPSGRRRAYSCDVTYVTNKELTFDYLRDRLTLSDRLDPSLLQMEYLHSPAQRSRRILLRGLHYGIVDEADSILIDEVRTPLIISGEQGGDEEKKFLTEALSLAENLSEPEDYVLDKVKRTLHLTPQGKQRLEKRSQKLGPLWRGIVRRESTLQQALTAVHLFHRDEQYLVRDAKIQIVDEFTGRVMGDRSWEQGLHQLIELKEGCALTKRRETLVKISYQQFFRRYLRLAGMTGTAREVAGEFWSVYNVPTVKVAPHRPLKRKKLAPRIYPTVEQKWQAVVQRIEELHETGRPVLVGTATVFASEQLSALVAERGLAHQVLNAKQDKEEAEIISRAGRAGGITIATDMAGRGTDIKLGKGVKELGGLHVIATEVHEAARIDRQLAGRCGRQGDPGSYELLLSLEDHIFTGGNRGLVSLFGQYFSAFSPIGQCLARRSMKHAQKRIEKYYAQVRKDIFRQTMAEGNLLSFSGPGE